MPTVSEMIVARVQRELAEFDAIEEAAAAGLVGRSSRHFTGPSAVFSIRLDRDELAALEQQAAIRNLKPSVFARNLIRTGLGQRNGAEIDRAFERVEEAVAALRTVVAH